ncbi:MAG: GTPase ObgE [Patescibacteria group bacterium]|nr:GTPase ObgE [Patescibacteria group bacterium]
MLIDDVTITIRGGNGGNGSVSFIRNAKTARGGPDGGNGGNGGSVFFQGSTDIFDLGEFRYKKKIAAENGVSGRKQNLYGRNGENIVIKVPLGTRITEASGKTYEVTDTTAKILLAAGGKGGRGNNEFKSATNQTPMQAENGTRGEEKVVHLELRLIAQVGLVGLPNAGKSSLLKELTNAHPKIGNYPFTTLEPNLGVLGGIVLGDIPGLMEGASKGKGLGIKFLKHVEKTKLLIHCIDSSTEDVVKAYKTVRNEFKEYDETLITKQEVILLTKTDLSDTKTLGKNINKLKKFKKPVLTISIYNEKSIEDFKKFIKEELNK